MHAGLPRFAGSEQHALDEKGRLIVPARFRERLGAQFVERFNRHKGGVDTRRVLKLAATGQSLVFFPEGTFTEIRQIGKFLGGAFTTAARSDMPVVAMAIHGTRAVLPPGGLAVHRLPIRVEILEVLAANEARQRSRELIARAVGEPLAP